MNVNAIVHRLAKPRLAPPWPLIAGFVGLVLGALIAIAGRSPVPTLTSLPEPRTIRLPPSPLQIAQPHLQRAAEQAKRAIDEHIETLDDFFEDSRKGTGTFASEALSWGSKWRLVVDYLPFTKGDRHQNFIRQKFEQRIFKADQLEGAVKSVVRSYLAHVHSIEGKMLVDLRADVADFPTAYPLAQLDDKRLQDSYDQALARAIDATGSDLRGDIGTQLVSIIAGEVLTQVAVRLGVSAGILGTGAASGYATFGIGLVVGVIVDYLVSWIWDWWADPKGNLAAELGTKLDEMNRLIVDGSDEVQGLRQRLRQYAQERAATRQTAVLSLLETPAGDLP